MMEALTKDNIYHYLTQLAKRLDEAPMGPAMTTMEIVSTFPEGHAVRATLEEAKGVA